MVRSPPAQEQLHEGKPQVGLEGNQQQGRVGEMTAMELYELLNKTDLKWDVVEIFEGARVLRFEIEEESDEVVQDKYGQ